MAYDSGTGTDSPAQGLVGKYGNFVFTRGHRGLLAVGAWNGWSWYEREQATRRPRIYGQVSRRCEASDAGQACDAGAAKIIEHYGRTAYAPMAALRRRRPRSRRGDVGDARRHSSVGDRQVRPRRIRDDRARAARRRAARREEVRRGAAGFSAAMPDRPAVAVADRRGDVLLAQGKLDEARAAYKQALDKAEPGHPLRGHRPAQARRAAGCGLNSVHDGLRSARRDSRLLRQLLSHGLCCSRLFVAGVVAAVMDWRLDRASSARSRRRSTEFTANAHADALPGARPSARRAARSCNRQ